MPFLAASNPGRPIAPDRVLSFANAEAANAWLRDNPERVMGGVHFSARGEQCWC